MRDGCRKVGGDGEVIRLAMSRVVVARGLGILCPLTVCAHKPNYNGPTPSPPLTPKPRPVIGNGDFFAFNNAIAATAAATARPEPSLCAPIPRRKIICTLARVSRTLVAGVARVRGWIAMRCARYGADHNWMLNYARPIDTTNNICISL